MLDRRKLADQYVGLDSFESEMVVVVVVVCVVADLKAD